MLNHTYPESKKKGNYDIKIWVVVRLFQCFWTDSAYLIFRGEIRTPIKTTLTEEARDVSRVSIERYPSRSLWRQLSPTHQWTFMIHGIIRVNIQQGIGPHEDLLIIGKRRKHAVVWTCLPFIRSGRNHLARHSERGNKTRQTEEEVGRQHQGMDWSSPSPRGQWRTGKNGGNWLWNHLWCPSDPRG